jgi:hypothetical protein
VGLFSRSSSVTNLTDQTNLQQSFEGTDGVAIGGDGNTVQVVDGGLVNAAADIGLEALELGRDSVEAAIDFAGRGQDNALAASRGALAFGETAISANERVVRGGFDFAGDALSEVATFGGRAIGEVADFGGLAINQLRDAQIAGFDFASDLFDSALSAQANLTESNLDGLGQLAQQTSASADDRVTKVALYAFLAIAAVFVLPKLFERG